MKSFLFSVFAFGTLNAFAAQLPEGTVALTSVAGELVSVRELCPKGAKCITNGTEIRIAYTASGCLDQLVEPVVKVEGQDVYVHAQIAENEQSANVKCVAAPFFVSQLSLIMKFKPLKIHFLGTQEVLDVK